MEGVNYHAAKEAITLATRAEDLMFACEGGFFFFDENGPLCLNEIFEIPVCVINWWER